MNRRVLLGVIAIVVAGAIIACILIMRGGEEENPTDIAQQIENTQSAAPDMESSKGNAAAVPTEAHTATASRPKKIDEAARKARAEMLAAILESVAKASKGNKKPRELSLDPGKAPKSERELLLYVRGPLREIRPLLRGCYQRALMKDQSLSGVVRVKFSIVADDENGGLIESSEIMESEDNAAILAMGECLQETMYALRFDKPTGAGRITVEYPMVFSTPENTPEVPKEQLKPKFEVEGFLSGD